MANIIPTTKFVVSSLICKHHIEQTTLHFMNFSGKNRMIIYLYLSLKIRCWSTDNHLRNELSVKFLIIHEDINCDALCPYISWVMICDTNMLFKCIFASKQSALFHGITVKKFLFMLLNSRKMNAVLFVKILKKWKCNYFAFYIPDAKVSYVRNTVKSLIQLYSQLRYLYTEFIIYILWKCWKIS